MPITRMTDFAHLKPSRQFHAQYADLPEQPERIEELTVALIKVMKHASPATLNTAIVEFLANYVWNSRETEGEAKGLLNEIVARTRKRVGDFYESEAEGVFLHDRKTN